MIIVAKNIKAKVKESGKQINKEAIMILDKYIDGIITNILSGQTAKRITGKTLFIK